MIIVCTCRRRTRASVEGGGWPAPFAPPGSGDVRGEDAEDEVAGAGADSEGVVKDGRLLGLRDSCSVGEMDVSAATLPLRSALRRGDAPCHSQSTFPPSPPTPAARRAATGRRYRAVRQCRLSARHRARRPSRRRCGRKSAGRARAPSAGSRSGVRERPSRGRSLRPSAGVGSVALSRVVSIILLYKVVGRGRTSAPLSTNGTTSSHKSRRSSTSSLSSPSR
jgi:hypothetical protein